MKYERLEDEDSTISAEEPMIHGQRKNQVTQRLNAFSAYSLYYCVLSTTVIIVLLAVNFVQMHTNVQHRIETPFETKATFGRDAKYMSVQHSYDSLWEDIKGSSEVFNLSNPAEHGKEMPAALAMFHQLHCLSSFRHAIQRAHEGIDPGIDWKSDPHWPHCFDYMRKTIMCWADGTIERQPYFRNGTIIPAIDGAQDVRRCGDNRKLIQIMKDAGKIVNTEPFP